MQHRDDLPMTLTLQQTADVLGLSIEKVRELVRSGRLPALFSDDLRIARIRRDDLFPTEQATRDLTIKRLRRLHIASQDARRDALQKFRELEAALSEWERTERALDAELLLTDLDTERTLRTAS